MANTPNMGLDLPIVEETLGPIWASKLNVALEAVDAHSHVPGQGAPVPSVGLNINADLPFNGFSAVGLGSVDLNVLGSALSSGASRLFSYGGELYYRDAVGNNVQITEDGVVDGAAAGSILGLDSPASAVFSSLTSQFGWFYDSGKPAAMQMGDLQIFPFNPPNTYTNYWTLKAPTALGSNLTITLPTTLPSSDNIVSISSAGVLTAGAAAGSASSPSIAFATDTDTGLYLSASNTLAMTTGGTLRAYLDATGINIASGSAFVMDGSAAASAPSLNFHNDSDTGIFRSGANVLGITTGGNARVLIDSAQIRGPSGTAGSPGSSFTADPDTGMYSAGANDLRFATGGQDRVGVTGGGLSMIGNGAIFMADGSASGPALSFISDTNTGIYLSAADTLSFSTDGVARLSLAAVTSTLTSNLALGGTLNIDSGGAFKVKLFSGSLSENTTVSLDAPSGSVFGAAGYTSTAGGFISMDSATADTGCRFIASGGTGSRVRIQNPLGSGGTRNYTVVMIYG